MLENFLEHVPPGLRAPPPLFIYVFCGCPSFPLPDDVPREMHVVNHFLAQSGQSWGWSQAWKAPATSSWARGTGTP